MSSVSCPLSDGRHGKSSVFAGIDVLSFPACPLSDGKSIAMMDVLSFVLCPLSDGMHGKSSMFRGGSYSTRWYLPT